MFSAEKTCIADAKLIVFRLLAGPLSDAANEPIETKWDTYTSVNWAIIGSINVLLPVQWPLSEPMLDYTHLDP